MYTPATSLQFNIRRVVAGALPIAGIAPKARVEGFATASLEYSIVSAQGQTRIACSQAMPIYLVEQMRA